LQTRGQEGSRSGNTIHRPFHQQPVGRRAGYRTAETYSSASRAAAMIGSARNSPTPRATWFLDDKVACKNLRCRRGFDVSGVEILGKKIRAAIFEPFGAGERLAHEL
jgi:hypothetical protein